VLTGCRSVVTAISIAVDPEQPSGNAVGAFTHEGYAFLGFQHQGGIHVTREALIGKLAL
jgi:hypothetical protein